MRRRRITKAEQRAALYKRVLDVYTGAAGYELDSDSFTNAEELGRILPALKSLFGHWLSDESYVWSLGNIGKYNDAARAAEFLFDAGVRA